MTSIPVARLIKGEGAVDAGSGLGTGGVGERRAVMACMLRNMSKGSGMCSSPVGNVPMEGSSESQIVVAGQLAHTTMELAVIDQTAGLVDDEEGKDNPVQCQKSQYM